MFGGSGVLLLLINSLVITAFSTLLTVGLGSMGLEWGPYMAVGAMAVLPIMIFTLVPQRHLVRGLTFGAVR
ncbi:MAG: hypothetical protein ACR2RF_24115 [Geminicoccaceae bacterium]